MDLTKRQEKILTDIIEEYIESAKPVGSLTLERKSDFEICPATIMIEMQKLTDGGYIFKPHTSAGRVPTDKGYRFFVNNLLEKSFKKDFDFEELFEQDSLRALQSVIRHMASLSSSLALGYLPHEKILLKEGWEDVVREPEFREEDFAFNFAEAVKSIEKEIGDFELDSGLNVFIGKENPLPKARQISTIMARCKFPDEEVFLAIVGPKRMSYDKNINYLKSLISRL